MLAGLAESVLAWRRLLSPLESVWDRSACLLMLLKLQAPVCAGMWHVWSADLDGYICTSRYRPAQVMLSGLSWARTRAASA
jgi:hypothetical protein